nr:hypothetical protein SHINE37_43278 [Rhizobiaceae bacterium]
MMEFGRSAFRAFLLHGTPSLFVMAGLGLTIQTACIVLDYVDPRLKAEDGGGGRGGWFPIPFRRIAAMRSRMPPSKSRLKFGTI